MERVARRRRTYSGLALILAVIAGGTPGCGEQEVAEAPAAPATERAEDPSAATEPAAAAPEPARYAGTARCASCHAAEYAAWRGSHHDLALQTLPGAEPLGDFDGATHSAHGTTTTFSREGDQLRVRTEGPGGEPTDFEVAHLFGVEPLQQLLIPLARGRLQAFGVAWDARPAAEGGQRWFSLYPDERIAPGDPLHWTGSDQRWNSMCAECHSTGVTQAYDAEADTYDVAWAEPDVACEACHGPGSLHVARAEAAAAGSGDWREGSGLAAPLLHDAEWERAPDAAIAQRTTPLRAHTEVETCAPCHARRSLLVETWQPGEPFLDVAHPAWIEPGLYHVDGAVEGEVFVTGSFLQSRMYTAGVTCSDCHEPHSLGLRAEGNALCGQCHSAAVFDTREHHAHAAGSAGAQCVACHMPATNFMQVDARRDHRFGVPRPDLSERFGVPNACTGCHSDRDAAWASAQLGGVEALRRPEDAATEAFAAARRHAAGAEALLIAVATDPELAGFVRASATAALRPFLAPSRLEPLAELARDADPLVRLAAATAGEALAPRTRLEAIEPALADPQRAVRLEAGRVLAPVPPSLWRGRDRAPLEDAVRAYLAAQELHADRPAALLNLGALRAVLRQPEAAARAYEQALALDPTFTPARINAADLARIARREADVEAILGEAIERDPGSAEAHHALGLARIRTGRKDEAIESLRRAAELAPDAARFAAIYALALNETGHRDAAVRVLNEAVKRRPDSRDLLYTLATVERDRGERDAALAAAQRLLERSPGDARAQRLVAELSANAP